MTNFPQLRRMKKDNTTFFELTSLANYLRAQALRPDLDQPINGRKLLSELANILEIV